MEHKVVLPTVGVDVTGVQAESGADSAESGGEQQHSQQRCSHDFGGKAALYELHLYSPLLNFIAQTPYHFEIARLRRINLNFFPQVPDMDGHRVF